MRSQGPATGFQVKNSDHRLKISNGGPAFSWSLAQWVKGLAAKHAHLNLTFRSHLEEGTNLLLKVALTCTHVRTERERESKRLVF